MIFKPLDPLAIPEGGCGRIRQLTYNTPLAKFARVFVVDLAGGKRTQMLFPFPSFLRVLHGETLIETGAGDIHMNENMFGYMPPGFIRYFNLRNEDTTRILVVMYKKFPDGNNCPGADALPIDKAKARDLVTGETRELWQLTKLSSDVSYTVSQVMAGQVPGHFYRESHCLYILTAECGFVGLGHENFLDVRGTVHIQTMPTLPIGFAGRNLTIETLRLPNMGNEDINWLAQDFSFPC